MMVLGFVLVVKYSSMARNIFVLRVFAESIMTDDLIFSIDLLVDL